MGNSKTKTEEEKKAQFEEDRLFLITLLLGPLEMLISATFEVNATDLKKIFVKEIKSITDCYDNDIDEISKGQISDSLQKWHSLLQNILKKHGQSEAFAYCRKNLSQVIEDLHKISKKDSIQGTYCQSSNAVSSHEIENSEVVIPFPEEKDPRDVSDNKHQNQAQQRDEEQPKSNDRRSVEEHQKPVEINQSYDVGPIVQPIQERLLKEVVSPTPEEKPKLDFVQSNILPDLILQNEVILKSETNILQLYLNLERDANALSTFKDLTSFKIQLDQAASLDFLTPENNLYNWFKHSAITQYEINLTGDAATNSIFKAVLSGLNQCSRAKTLKIYLARSSITDKDFFGLMDVLSGMTQLTKFVIILRDNCNVTRKAFDYIRSGLASVQEKDKLEVEIHFSDLPNGPTVNEICEAYHNNEGAALKVNNKVISTKST